MKAVLIVQMVICLCLYGCGRKEVSSEKAKTLNAEVAMQGYEKELEKLRAENKALKEELSAEVGDQ